MHRFLLTGLDKKVGGDFVISSEDLVHQWTKVLKFKVGEKVALFDGFGKEWEVQIEEIRSKEVSCKVVGEIVKNSELPVRIVLAQSLLKNPEKLEWILQKGTELGVSCFVPIISQRTERQTLHKRPRLESIIREAVEQSGRAFLPVLDQEIKLRKFLDGCGENSLILVANFDGKKKILELSERIKDVDEVILLVGPEGGFTEDERKMFADFKEKAVVVNLGKRVLRAETAAIVMAALCASEFE